MSNSKKSSTLEKAYADIILNNAKEAAVKILASESKAQRYNRELLATKDNALHMLLRLKEMLDAKVKEAEMMHLSQQKRIEVLEAQLGEAEDIVKDLRVEVRELQDELAKVMQNQMQHLGEQISEVDAATMVTNLEENGLSTSGSVISSPSAPDVLFITSQMTSSTFNGIYGERKCYTENNSHKDFGILCNLDSESMYVNRKEPEQCRRQCTQNSCSNKRHSLEESLPLSGQVAHDDKHMTRPLTLIGDHAWPIEKCLLDFKFMNANASCIQVDAANSMCKRQKKMTKHKKYDFLLFERHDELAEDIGGHTGQGSKIIEIFERKSGKPHMAADSTLDANILGGQQESFQVTKSNAGLVKCCISQNAKKDKLLIKEELKGCNDSSTGCADLVTSKFLCINSILEESGANRNLNNKLLKYTFRRKMKELPNNQNIHSSFENSILQTNVEKQSAQESLEYGLEAKSSREHLRGRWRGRVL